MRRLKSVGWGIAGVLLLVLGCSSGDDSGGDGDGDGDGDLPGDGDGDLPSSGGSTVVGDGDGDASSSGGSVGDGDGDGDTQLTGGNSGGDGDDLATGGSGTGGESDGTGGAPEECSNEYPAASCEDLGVWPTDQADAEEEILAIVNEHRAAGATCGGEAMPAVGPLVMDETLRCAARLHSQDMADRDFFSHATWNPDACACSNSNECGQGFICDDGAESTMRCGKSPGTRVADIGGPSGAGWENIAAGNDTAEETMDQWMTSEGHCRNIMNGDLQTIGVGYAQGGDYGHYWTQSFDN